jgi:nucleotide-binding universal stress UspA family protein
VVLVHCHKPFPSALGEPYYQQAIDNILQTAQELLKPFRSILTEGEVVFEERILEGPARQAIAQAAVVEKADLIIMGTRGLGNLEGLVLGSVTHKVLQTADCPVLVVR